MSLLGGSTLSPFPKLFTQVVLFPMTKVTVYMGIDIGKHEIAMTLMVDNNSPYVEKNKELNSKRKRNNNSDPAVIFQGFFRNQLCGFRKMLEEAEKMFSRLGIKEDIEIHIAMEATGTYYMKLARFLYNLQEENSEDQEKSNREYSLYVLNPRQVKHFGQSLNIINSNDKADSCVIAKCIRASVLTGDRKFRKWAPGRNSVVRLRELVRTRNKLLKMQVMERNRKEALIQDPEYSEVVLQSLEEHIEFLQQKIDEIGDIIESNAKNRIYSEDVQKEIELLCTIPGISYITAATFIAEIKDIDNFDSVKKVVAYFGLAPSQKTSGTSVRHKAKISKKGPKDGRACIYMAVLSAIQYNPAIKEFYNRVIKNCKGRAKGEGPEKEKMVAVVACMRKMVHIMYGMLKNETPFDLELAMSSGKKKASKLPKAS
jgi:transposase